MKIALFLGAGASVPFGKPTTEQLKRKLISSYQDLNSELLQSFLQDPSFPDIEYVLQAVRDIRKFAESSGGKYFFTKGQNGIFTFKNGTLPFSTFVQRLETVNSLLEIAVYDNYRWDHDFDDSLLEIYNQIFGFLQRLNSEIRIYTTNYDRVIEQYCTLTRTRHRLVDGFVRTSPDSEISEWSGNFENPSNDPRASVRLYKLHGSLNWKSHRRFELIKTNEEAPSNDANYPRNIVILPTLSPKDEEVVKPFNELRQHFESYMKEADICIVVGFSFRDNLNDIFKDFIKRGKRLISISPTAIPDFRKNVLKENPSYQDFQQWEKTLDHKLNIPIDGVDNSGVIILLQKPLATDTVREILDYCNENSHDTLR